MPRKRKQDAQPAKENLLFLEHAAIVASHPLTHGSNRTFLVDLRGEEDSSGQAVYKPRDGEATLWDFPTGTLYLRERAAYVLAEALGWRFVPPTVLRDGPYGPGSFQQFVEHDAQQHYFTLKDGHVQEFQRMCAFDWLANNADRKAGHCLLGPDSRVWSIDHGITFNAVPKLRTVIWNFAGQPMADDILADLERVGGMLNAPSRALAELPKLLQADELAALQERHKRIMQRRHFPEQHEGRVPWPWL